MSLLCGLLASCTKRRVTDRLLLGILSYYWWIIHCMIHSWILSHLWTSRWIAHGRYHYVLNILVDWEVDRWAWNLNLLFYWNKCYKWILTIRLATLILLLLLGYASRLLSTTCSASCGRLLLTVSPSLGCCTGPHIARLSSLACWLVGHLVIVHSH